MSGSNKTTKQQVEEIMVKFRNAGFRPSEGTFDTANKYLDQAEVVDQILALIEKEKKEYARSVVPEEKESGYRCNWLCEDHGKYGREGEYCSKCRKKLTKKEEKWPEDEDDSFNQCRTEILRRIGDE